MSRNSRFIDSKSIDSRIGVSRKILKKREGEEKTKKGREKKKRIKKKGKKKENRRKKRERERKKEKRREREGERGNRIEFLVSSSSPPPPPRSITFDEFQRVETVARCGYNFIQFFIADMLNW